MLDYVPLFDLLMKNFLIDSHSFIRFNKKCFFLKASTTEIFYFVFAVVFFKFFLTTSFVTCVLVECDLFSDKKILEFLYFIFLKYKNSFVVIVLIVLM